MLAGLVGVKGLPHGLGAVDLLLEVRSLRGLVGGVWGSGFVLQGQLAVQRNEVRGGYTASAY